MVSSIALMMSKPICDRRQLHHKLQDESKFVIKKDESKFVIKKMKANLTLTVIPIELAAMDHPRPS
jgi:hypothetical protein